jgi:hypothetical protein
MLYTLPSIYHPRLLRQVAIIRKITTLLRREPIGRRIQERQALALNLKKGGYSHRGLYIMEPICSIEFRSANDSSPTSVESAKWAKSIINTGSELASGAKENTLCGSFLPNLTVVVKAGDAELLVSPQALNPYNISNLDSQYSAHFRIPPATLFDLPEREYTTRAQKFAIGSLVYTIMVGRPPFADLDDSLVQQNFEKGVYPPETMELPLEIAISVLGFWSQEFAQQLTKHVGHHGKPIQRSAFIFTDTNLQYHPHARTAFSEKR